MRRRLCLVECLSGGGYPLLVGIAASAALTNTPLEDPLPRAMTKKLLAIGVCSALFTVGCSQNGEETISLITPSVVTIPPAPTEATPMDTPVEGEPTETATATTTAPETMETGKAAQAPALPLDASGAITLAVEHKPGAAVVEIDSDDGLWEINLLASDGQGIELHVEVATGDVIHERETSLSSSQREAPGLTAREAVEIALAEKPGALESLDLDHDSGKLAWDAIVIATDGVEWELYLDAASGELLRIERDD